MTPQDDPNSQHLQRAIAGLFLAVAAGAAQQSPAVDCFDATEFAGCARLHFSRQPSLGDDLPEVFTDSVLGHPTISIDGRDAMLAAGFPLPTQGLAIGDGEFRASVSSGSPHNVPIDNYALTLGGDVSIGALLEQGGQRETQSANFHSINDASIRFEGTSGNVEVKFSYALTAEFTAPTGAKDLVDGGALSLIGEVSIYDPLNGSAPAPLLYNGQFLFLPSVSENQASASNDWNPNDVLDVGLPDSIDADEELERAVLSVKDEYTFTATAGVNYNFYSFLTGGGTGELFARQFLSGDRTSWSARTIGGAEVQLEVLTPDAQLVVATPIPEATTMVAVMMCGLSLSMLGGRICGVG